MLNAGYLAALEAVLRSTTVDSPRDKEAIVATVRRVLNITEPDAKTSALSATDCVLSLPEAANRLARTVRTIKYLVATNQLRGLRTGRSGKLGGIPASALDAYIADGTTDRRHPAPQQEEQPA